MTLCSTCNSIDIRSLLLVSFEKHSEDSPHDEAESCSDSQGGHLAIRHHDDIFKVLASAKTGCELCGIIYSNFEGKGLEDTEIAKGLPLVFTKQNDNVVMSFDSPEGLIRLCSFDVYMEQNSIHIQGGAPCGILNKVHTDPSCQSCLTLAAGWLRDCMEHHAECSTLIASRRKLPTRVLNVGDRTRNPFLIQPPSESPLEEWVALSYCWGGEPSLKLTKLTIRTLTQGIPLDRFEATIRDAILVTRGLGITYLWVDALCIFQDEDSSDWNEQSSKMSEIYGGSTVTIVAADSSSVTEGFLQQRELQYIAMDWLPSTMFSDKSQLNTDTRHVYLSPSWNPDKDKMVGPWSKRGWTMQEGLLPNRLLFYTSYQMAWKCRTVIKYERGAACEPSAEVIRGFIDYGGSSIWTFDAFTKFKLLPWYLQSLSSESISERYRLWYELVEDYTPRHFKYIQDRLIAISGLAKIFGDLISDQYFAGLWKRDMVRGLVWHASGAKLIPNNSTDNPSFHVNTAPSWSWASVGSNVAVVNDHADQDGFRALAKIEDVEVELVNPSNPFGAANAGSVIITGPLARLSRLHNNEWRFKDRHMSALERHISEVVEKESVQGVEEKYSVPSNSHYMALQMLQHFPSIDRRLDLLILEATGITSKKGLPTYRRVGVLTLRHFAQSCLASPELAKVCERSKHSLQRRLDPDSGPRRVRRFEGKEAFLELVSERWPLQTVVIV